jgi:hypothetical protein
MQPKYKSRKAIDTDILVTKWKLFAPKRKTTPEEPKPRNRLTEELTSFKIVILTIPL